MEAWTLCEKCLRWLCGRHAGDRQHGYEVSIDEQYEQIGGRRFSRTLELTDCERSHAIQHGTKQLERHAVEQRKKSWNILNTKN